MPEHVPQSIILSQEETDAFNKHGIFFKKKVLRTLSEIPDVKIVSEELGVSFGENRVIDILAKDDAKSPYIYFVFECKRAFTSQKRWFFFKDVDQRYRICRTVSSLDNNGNIFGKSEPFETPICSEGYELRSELKSGKGLKLNANQDPVFQAASQLSSGYLGLVRRRAKEISGRTSVTMQANLRERYVPVLVTNADLILLNIDPEQINLDNGNIMSLPTGKTLPALILKHPIPTPSGIERDIRDWPNPSGHWDQHYKESLYVVHSSALKNFMSSEHRDYLRSADS
jgi:hypothetical protein